MAVGTEPGNRRYAASVVELAKFLDSGPHFLGLDDPISVKRVVQGEVVRVGVNGRQVVLVPVVDVCMDGGQLQNRSDTLHPVRRTPPLQKRSG